MILILKIEENNKKKMENTSPKEKLREWNGLESDGSCLQLKLKTT